VTRNEAPGRPAEAPCPPDDPALVDGKHKMRTELWTARVEDYFAPAPLADERRDHVLLATTRRRRCRMTPNITRLCAECKLISRHKRLSVTYGDTGQVRLAQAVANIVAILGGRAISERDT